MHVCRTTPSPTALPRRSNLRYDRSNRPAFLHPNSNSNLNQDGKIASNKQMNCVSLSTACTACSSSTWLSAAITRGIDAHGSLPLSGRASLTDICFWLVTSSSWFLSSFFHGEVYLCLVCLVAPFCCGDVCIREYLCGRCASSVHSFPPLAWSPRLVGVIGLHPLPSLFRESSPQFHREYKCSRLRVASCRSFIIDRHLSPVHSLSLINTCRLCFTSGACCVARIIHRPLPPAHPSVCPL